MVHQAFFVSDGIVFVENGVHPFVVNIDQSADCYVSIFTTTKILLGLASFVLAALIWLNVLMMAMSQSFQFVALGFVFLGVQSHLTLLVVAVSFWLACGLTGHWA